MLRISACTIAKNEAENIPRWLESAKIYADEIIVVDTGSSDDTAELAAAAGADVYHYEWHDDFAAAKNFALSKATGDWVVFCDADEYFTEDTVGRVRYIIEDYDADENIAGLVVPMLNIEVDTGQTFGGAMYPQRIFRRVPWIRFQGSIHETVENTSGDGGKQMVAAQGLLLYHTGYSPRIMRRKTERNLRLILDRQAREGEHPLDNYHLMDVYYSLEDYPQAINYAKKTLAGVQPVSADNRAYQIWMQSLVYLKAGYEEITEAYEAAVADAPYDLIPPLIYAVYTWEMGYYLRAGKILVQRQHFFDGGEENGIPANRLSNTIYPYLSDYYLLCGDYEAAILSLQKGLKFNKYSVNALRRFIYITELMGEDDAGLLKLLKALAIYDENDADFLVSELMATRFHKACLFYERQAQQRLTDRQRYLLAGRSEIAAASLTEELSARSSAAVAKFNELSPSTAGQLAILLPAEYRGEGAAQAKVGVQRRVAGNRMFFAERG